jgi:hypothetical protein
MQPEQILVPCPSCHAWPMAIKAVEPSRSGKRGSQVVRFYCAKCGHHDDRMLSDDAVTSEDSALQSSRELATEHQG